MAGVKNFRTVKPSSEFWDYFSFEDFAGNYYKKFDVFDDIVVKFISPKIKKSIARNYTKEEKEKLTNFYKILCKDLTTCSKCPGLNSIEGLTMAGYPYGIPYKTVYYAFGQSLHSYNPRNIYFQIPFKGNIPKKDSGILLYNGFNLAGIIERENLMVSNVVKCHPPGNRGSKPYEIKNCQSFLIVELTTINPLVLVPIGKDAWNFVITNFDFSLTELYKNSYVQLFFSNSEKLKETKFIIKLTHPSYIQRRGNKLKDKIDFIKGLIKANEIIVKEFEKMKDKSEKFYVINIKDFKVPFYEV